MADTFSNSELREHHQNVLHYQLPATSMTLAQIFSHMEQARVLFNVEDYAVSQTTLDQVADVVIYRADLISTEIITPPPVGERGIVFGQFLSFFLSLFLCQQHYEKTARPICMKFSGKVWNDHGTT